MRRLTNLQVKLSMSQVNLIMQAVSNIKRRIHHVPPPDNLSHRVLLRLHLKAAPLHLGVVQRVRAYRSIAPSAHPRAGAYLRAMYAQPARERKRNGPPGRA